MDFDLSNPSHWHAVAYETRPYPWQYEAMSAFESLADAAIRRDIPPGTRAVVIASRQAGKNELMARFEARMLTKYSGSIREAVKAAPVAKPTLHISKTRLKRVMGSKLFQSLPKNFVYWEEGYICKVGKASQVFLSCEPSANRVGHTASLYLSVDEAQDVDNEIYTKDLRPMLLRTGSLTLLSGTSWDKASLIEVERERARSAQKRLGVRLLYEYPWWRVAEESEFYGKTASAEIELLGEDHPIIMTQYRLIPVDKMGSFLNEAGFRKLQGTHRRLSEPVPGRHYVAGVDWCGSTEQDEADILRDPERIQKRDSGVVTIGELVWNQNRIGQKVPTVRVVDHLFFTARQPMDMIDEVFKFIFERWKCLYCVSDASGVGDMPSSVLCTRRPNQVTPLKSSLSLVSSLGFNLLGAINTERFKIYSEDSDTHRECMFQFRECRREMRSQGYMRFGAPNAKVQTDWSLARVDVHDDFVKSASYCLDAAMRLEYIASNHNPTHRTYEEPELDAFDDY